ncbi:hypothetical protein I552_6379 [Mycobacterium xenopi 3993]|nr:hypothetical protein I552_6379 [Mycobacterium xenopi 3993]
MGRQLDWMVCRTVATLLRAKPSSQPVRLLHVDDLIRFLVRAAATNRGGSVDLATFDTTHVLTAGGCCRWLPAFLGGTAGHS